MTESIADPRLIMSVLGAIIGFAGMKLFWGAALWAQKTEHRIGDRWGREPVEVAEWADGKGYVIAGGELWRASSKDQLQPGDSVVVSKAKGLTLEVRKG